MDFYDGMIAGFFGTMFILAGIYAWEQVMIWWELRK